MRLTKFRNVSAATAAGLSQLLSRGQVLVVRGKEIREIRNNVIVLERPTERVLFLPHRGNNVFTAIAETMWVLNGRNDVLWLKNYLPRASDFSDDGLTWRAAYGPRLRDWRGVDQIEKVRDLLLSETTSRRAAMSLYDPAVDFVESKDIPCNNWLHWLIRDGQLHLNIGVRSNDIVWGFSGINAFEWSVLHELMASWLGVEVGEATYFASSFHLYNYHYQMAQKAAAAFRSIYCYDHGIAAPKFSTPWQEFGKAMATWFELEAEIRKSPDKAPRTEDYIGDELLRGLLDMVYLYNGAASGWVVGRIADELSKMPPTDLTVAAYEYFARKHSEILERIPNSVISLFFANYNDLGGSDGGASSERLLEVIKSLHSRKDKAYGSAWKKRGELTSVLANIARKVDRLDQFNINGAELTDESVLDTAADLFVYSAKYVLFLMEQPGAASEDWLPKGSPVPFSDHVVNFNLQLDHISRPKIGDANAKEIISLIASTFEEMHRNAVASIPPSDRMAAVVKFRDISFALVEQLYKLDPQKLSSIP
jgi:thymidylate synthase